MSSSYHQPDALNSPTDDSDSDLTDLTDSDSESDDVWDCTTGVITSAKPSAPEESPISGSYTIPIAGNALGWMKAGGKHMALWCAQGHPVRLIP